MRQDLTNYVAAVIYDTLRSEVLSDDKQCSGGSHRSCVPRMDLISECRSTEVHDLFRRVADRVLSEVNREQAEVRSKPRCRLKVVRSPDIPSVDS